MILGYALYQWHSWLRVLLEVPLRRDIRRVRPVEAARFSFLMAVPLLLGAAAVKVPDLLRGGDALAIGPAAVGFVASLVSGYLAIRWLLRMLARGRFLYFGVYCALLGMAGLLLS